MPGDTAATAKVYGFEATFPHTNWTATFVFPASDGITKFACDAPDESTSTAAPSTRTFGVPKQARFKPYSDRISLLLAGPSSELAALTIELISGAAGGGPGFTCKVTATSTCPLLVSGADTRIVPWYVPGSSA